MFITSSIYVVEVWIKEFPELTVCLKIYLFFRRETQEGVSSFASSADEQFSGQT